MNITNDEILDAIRQALEQTGGNEGFTTQELAEMSGKSATVVRRALRVMLTSGRAEPVWVRRTLMTGAQQRIAGYRLT